MEEENKKNQPGQGGNGFQVTSGIQGGASGQTGTSKVAPGAMGPKTVDQGVKKGSGFTNLSSYLDANKGEGSRMAGVASTFEQKKADEQKAKLKEEQGKVTSGYDTTLALKDFDENLLAGDVSKMNPAQLALFQSTYGGDVAAYEKAKADRAKQFDINQQATELGEYDIAKTAYGDVEGRASRFKDVFGGGSKQYNPNAKGSLLDSYLTGTAGGEAIGKTVETGKTGYTDAVNQGDVDRLAKIEGLKGKQVAENEAVKNFYGKQMGLRDADLTAAQKVNTPKYEDYTGATEFALADEAGIQAAKAKVDAINAKNKAAYDAGKSEFTKKGAEALARRNALAGLTKQAAAKIDFDKLFGAYTGNRDVNLTTKAPEFKPGTEGSDPFTEYVKETGTTVSDGLKDIKPKVIDATNPNPIVSTPAQVDVVKTVHDTANRVDPIQQAAGGYFKMNKWGIPEWVSTGGGGGGGSSSGGGGGSSSRSRPTAMK